MTMFPPNPVDHWFVIVYVSWQYEAACVAFVATKKLLMTKINMLVSKMSLRGVLSMRKPRRLPAEIRRMISSLSGAIKGNDPHRFPCSIRIQLESRSRCAIAHPCKREH